MPNAANTAEVVRRLAAAAPAGVEVTDEHTTYAVIAVQGPRVRRGAGRRGAARPGSTTCTSSDAAWQGRPVVVCRTGYTGERGYELLPLWDDAGAAVGRAAGRGRGRRGAAVRARRAGHAAHRDGLPAARPGPVPVDHAGRGPAVVGGRLGEGRGSGAATPCSPSGRRPAPVPAGWPGGCSRPVAESRGRTARCGRRRARRSGVTTSGTFSPTLRRGSRWPCWTARCAEGDELVVDVRGRDLPVRVVKPPFVRVRPAALRVRTRLKSADRGSTRGRRADLAGATEQGQGDQAPRRRRRGGSPAEQGLQPERLDRPRRRWVDGCRGGEPPPRGRGSRAGRQRARRRRRRHRRAAPGYGGPRRAAARRPAADQAGEPSAVRGRRPGRPPAAGSRGSGPGCRRPASPSLVVEMRRVADDLGRRQPQQQGDQRRRSAPRPRTAGSTSRSHPESTASSTAAAPSRHRVRGTSRLAEQRFWTSTASATAESCGPDGPAAGSAPTASR